MLRRILLGVLLCLVAAAPVVLAGCSEPKKDIEVERKTSVQTRGEVHTVVE